MKYGKFNDRALDLPLANRKKPKGNRGRDGLTDSQRNNREAYKKYTNGVICEKLPKAKNGKPYKTPARAKYFLTISGRLHELEGGEKNEKQM